MPAGETLELLNRIQTTRSKDELTDVVRDVGKRFGFTAFALSHYRPDAGGGQNVEFMLHHLPERFALRFIAENYGRTNPITRRAQQSDEPFFWHDIRYDDEAEPEAHRVMQEAAAAGLTDGFCVPVHMPHGERGLVSFLRDGTASLDEEDLLALQAAALAAHAQVLYLARPAASQAPRLTAREREVLKWTAAGKTAEATAAILSISVRTVEYHLLNAARKLNTANRTHTVVEALRSRQLSL
ncbi:MAG TPA: LuxR family transcriptional regulator [Devosia sp.]